jgi:hypothetical protein
MQPHRSRARAAVAALIGAHMTAVIVLGSQAQPIDTRLPITIAVEHEHSMGSCTGELTVDKWVFTFTSKTKPEDSRTWKVTEIRQVESKRPSELIFRTRESGMKTLGQDRNYKFKVPGDGASRELVDFMNDRVR